jgi:hypothetical protein
MSSAPVQTASAVCVNEIIAYFVVMRFIFDFIQSFLFGVQAASNLDEAAIDSDVIFLYPSR